MGDPHSPSLELVVSQVTQEADGVVGLDLVHADGEPLPAWEPGAHIDLILELGLERQYSLCGDPCDRSRWRVAVLLEPAGRGGSARIHQFIAGDRVSGRGPRNHFRLRSSGRYLFIAGGIGITPLLPMIAAVSERGGAWKLVYGGRASGSMAFVRHLQSYGSAVTLWPQDERGLLPLDELLGTPSVETVIYCCGPEPLICAVEERCAIWPSDSLHTERFQPRAEPLDRRAAPFQVALARGGGTVDVGVDETIVDALEKVRISVPTSCREGTCGTCETRVLEGVPDHRDSILDQSERAAGDTMMICCSRSLTPRLVLDI